MRFAYYDRLSRKARAIYDASDAIVRIDLSDAQPARGACDAARLALAAADRRALRKAAQALADAICADRAVPSVEIRVLAKRPRSDVEELHGLYLREEDGTATIRVWMRTAARRDVVKPKTFIQTLLHEVVHHLDYDLLKLADSLHTEGFYKRVTSLFRQVGGELVTAVNPRRSSRAVEQAADVEPSPRVEQPAQVEPAPKRPAPKRERAPSTGRRPRREVESAQLSLSGVEDSGGVVPTALSLRHGQS